MPLCTTLQNAQWCAQVLTHVRTKLVFWKFDAKTQTFTKQVRSFFVSFFFFCSCNDNLASQVAKGGDELVPAGVDVAVRWRVG